MTPTTRTCEKCGRTFLLVHFRRWHGGKRQLFLTCNACKPELAFNEMTKLQQQEAIQAGRINPLVAQTYQITTEDRRRARLSGIQLRRRTAERRKGWDEVLFNPIRAELTWAGHALNTCVRGQQMQAQYLPDVPPTPAVAAIYARWQEFFESYIGVLKDMRYRARSRLGIARGGKLNPTPEELSPTTYVFPETLGALRRMYSECRPLPGRKPFREPWLISWKTGGQNEL